MKIATVCGMGSGSSLILKMAVDDILQKHNIHADVEACDLGSISGMSVDLVISTSELKLMLDHLPVQVVFVNNVIDKNAIEEVLLKALSSF